MPRADIDMTNGVTDIDLSKSHKDFVLDNASDKQLLADVRKTLIDKINLADYDKSEIERFQNDDHAVRRYLRYDSKDYQATIHKSAAYIRDVLEWRRTNDLCNATENDFSDFVKQLPSWQVFGKDKDGANIFWLRACKHKRTDNSEEARRHLAYRIDQLDHISDQCGWICAWDCYQVGTSNIDLEMVRFITNCLPMYRGNLRYVLVLDMGWIATASWKIIRAWLPQEHRDAIRFSSRKELKDFVDDDELPDYFHKSRS